MFVYFGSNEFNQLNCVSNEIFAIASPDIKFFTRLSTLSRPKIDDIYIGWSYLVLKAGDKVYRSGFLESKKENNIQLLPELSDINVDAITCGLKNTFILSNKGFIQTFQRSDIDLGVNNGNIQIVITDDLISLALTTDGRVIILDETTPDRLLPYILPVPVPVKEVFCGKEHVLLLSYYGKVFSFGFGSRGQLGHGSIENVDKPSIVEALEGIAIKTISCGGWHSAAISMERDLYMWGWNESGQLGLPCSELHSEDTPMEEIETICCLPKVIDLADESPKTVGCGSRHTAVITEENNLWTWGWNGYGQLGHKRNLLSDKPQRVDLPMQFVPSKLKCKFWSTLICGDIKES